MARRPYAARTFVEQVSEMRKSTKYEFGDEDGLGVFRSVTFDKPTSKWLAPVLDEVEDRRITNTSTTGGKLTVTFSHRSNADSREPFPLEAAKTVADWKKSQSSG